MPAFPRHRAPRLAGARATAALTYTHAHTQRDRPGHGTAPPGVAPSPTCPSHPFSTPFATHRRERAAGRFPPARPTAARPLSLMLSNPPGFRFFFPMYTATLSPTLPLPLPRVNSLLDRDVERPGWGEQALGGKRGTQVHCGEARRGRPRGEAGREGGGSSAALRHLRQSRQRFVTVASRRCLRHASWPAAPPPPGRLQSRCTAARGTAAALGLAPLHGSC